MSVYDMTPAVRRLQRQGIRKQLAALELVRRRCSELRAQIQAIEASSDRAAHEHRAAIGPIKEQLDAIATEQVAEISAGREPAPAQEKRRKQLLAQRDAANLLLQQILDRNAALLKPLQQELRGLEKQTAGYTVLQNEIANHADDADLDRAYLWQQKIAWLRARGKDGARRLAELESVQTIEREKQRPDKELLAAIARRIRRAKLEGGDINADIAATTEQQELLRARLLETED